MKTSGKARRGYLLAIGAAVGWSTGGLISHWLMTVPGVATRAWRIQPLGAAITSPQLSAARALSATLILGLVLLVVARDTFRLEHPGRDLLFLVPFGAVALAGMHFTYFQAIVESNVTTAILLEYLAPVLTLIYGIVVLRKRVSWQMPLGVVLALVGCATVVGAFHRGGLLISRGGLVWGLAAACFFALYSIMGGVGNRRFAPFQLLFYGLFFATCMWLVVLGPRTVIAPFLHFRTAVPVVVIACISTIIPFGCYLLALQYIPPTNATIAAMLEPVIAAFVSWGLFGQRFSWTYLVGGSLIIGAIILIQAFDRDARRGEFPVQD